MSSTPEPRDTTTANTPDSPSDMPTPHSPSTMSIPSTPSTTLSPTALTLLHALSFLHSDLVPEPLLLTGASQCSISLPSYPTTHHTYTSARHELTTLSLIAYDPVTETLHMHPLVQDAVRKQLDAAECIAVVNGAVALMCAVWPFTEFGGRNRNRNDGGNGDKEGRWGVYEMYLPHCERVREVLEERMDMDGKSGGGLGVADISIDAVRLFNDAAWYSVERALPSSIERYALTSLAILDKISPSPDVHTPMRRISSLRSSSTLKLAIAAQSRLDGPAALTHATTALHLLVACLDDWHAETDSLLLAQCYNNLAIAYALTSDVPSSLHAWSLALRAFQSRVGGRVRDGTWPAVSLSLVYARRGEVGRAGEVLGPVYEAVVREGDGYEGCFETGAILRAMGHLRVAEGRFEEGLDFHERALRNLRATLGNAHFQTGDCMYDVARGVLRFGRGEEASKLIDEALQAWGETPQYRPTAARALWTKGRWLRESGRELGAEGYLRKAMELRKVLVPEDGREEGELREEDWTGLVYYYSK